MYQTNTATLAELATLYNVTAVELLGELAKICDSEEMAGHSDIRGRLVGNSDVYGVEISREERGCGQTV